MTRAAIGAALAACLFGAATAASAQTSVADLPLAGGIEERVVFAGPPDPAAILVMLAGGDGIVEIDGSGNIGRLGGNCLLRTRGLWLEQGVAIAVPGSPGDASLDGKRLTPAYADALGRVVDFAKEKANAPVWLVGTSNGTMAAVNGAARLGGRISGVVLTSSVTRSYGESVLKGDLRAIAVPVLIVADRGDTCPASPAEDAPRIAAALSRAPRKEIVLFASSEIRSAPCQAMSPHGYLGIEREVVARISQWVRAATGR